MSKEHISYLTMGPTMRCLGVTHSKKRFLKEWKRLANVDFEHTESFDAYGFVDELVNKDNGSHLTLVYLNTKLYDSKPAHIAGVCAHEAAHCAQLIWKDMGERDIGREADAHLIQFLTISFYEYIVEKAEKHANKLKNKGSDGGTGNSDNAERDSGSHPD